MHQAAMVKIYASELLERLGETALDLLATGAATAWHCGVADRWAL